MTLVITWDNCDQRWQLWPHVTTVTTCDNCDYMWQLLRHVTIVTTCDNWDEWQLWPHVTIVETCDNCDHMWNLLKHMTNLTICDSCDDMANVTTFINCDDHTAAEVEVSLIWVTKIWRGGEFLGQIQLENAYFKIFYRGSYTTDIQKLGCFW